MKHTRWDLLKWVAAACALVATASAEYELARAVHFTWWVALAVPGALDAYVLRALQTGREVFTAVLAMVAVNAASHLVTAGMLPVRWWLVTAVASVPALVLWRVHALRTPAEARLDTLHGVPAGTHPNRAQGGPREHGPNCTCRDCLSNPPVMGTKHVVCPWCGYDKVPSDMIGVHLSDSCPNRFELRDTLTSTERPDAVPEFQTGDVYPCVACSQPVVFTGENGWSHGPFADPCPLLDTAFASTVPVPDTVPDTVPEEWSRRSTDEDTPPSPVSDGHAPERREHEGVPDPSVPDDWEAQLNPFTMARWEAPSVPDRDVPATVTPLDEHRSTDVLRAGDKPALDKLRAHMCEHSLGAVPAMRDVKVICGVGTPRARRVHKAMLAEHRASTDGGAS